MSLNAIVPFDGPRASAEISNRSAARKSKKRASRNRRKRTKPMDSSPIRSLVHTPVPSIIYPEVPSVVPSPFDTPQHSSRGNSPSPDVEVNSDIPVESRVVDIPGGGAEEPPAILVADAPLYQDNSLESSSPESTRTRTPSIGATSSSSSSSTHSRSNSRTNTSSKSYTSARSQRPRPRSARTQRARPHRRRSISSPNGWYRLTAMEEARKKGRPVKYGVTRDLKVAFMRESGTVNIGKRPVFGFCVIL